MMIIKNFTPLLPVSITLQIRDNTEHEIFALVYPESSMVLVPDEKQYNLIEEDYDDFVDLVQEYTKRFYNLNSFSVPNSVIKNISTIKKDMQDKQEIFNSTKENIETNDRMPTEDDLKQIITEESEER